VAQGDVGFRVEVGVASAEHGFRLRVVPRAFSQSPDSPRGQEMTHEDANWPGWADAKADTVQFKIHQKCRAAPPGSSSWRRQVPDRARQVAGGDGCPEGRRTHQPGCGCAISTG